MPLRNEGVPKGKMSYVPSSSSDAPMRKQLSGNEDGEASADRGKGLVVDADESRRMSGNSWDSWDDGQKEDEQPPPAKTKQAFGGGAAEDGASNGKEFTMSDDEEPPTRPTLKQLSSTASSVRMQERPPTAASVAASTSPSKASTPTPLLASKKDDITLSLAEPPGSLMSPDSSNGYLPLLMPDVSRQASRHGPVFDDMPPLKQRAQTEPSKEDRKREEKERERRKKEEKEEAKRQEKARKEAEEEARRQERARKEAEKKKGNKRIAVQPLAETDVVEVQEAPRGHAAGGTSHRSQQQGGAGDGRAEYAEYAGAAEAAEYAEYAEAARSIQPRDSGFTCGDYVDEQKSIVLHFEATGRTLAAKDLDRGSSLDTCGITSEREARRSFASTFRILRVLIDLVLAFVFEALSLVLYVVQKLLVETLQLVGNLFWKPLLATSFNTFLQPLFVCLLNVFTGVSSAVRPLVLAFDPAVQYLVSILRAIRLVEWNARPEPSSEIEHV